MKKKSNRVLPAALSGLLAISLCPAFALADEVPVEVSGEGLTALAADPASGAEEGAAAPAAAPAAAEPAAVAEPAVTSAGAASEPAALAATTLEISTADQLRAFAAQVNGGDAFSGKTVVLTADIDLGNAYWAPIGLKTDELGFCGTFDGQGHTISNLLVSTTNNAAGLFGAVRGTLKNFTVRNASVSNLVTDSPTDEGTAIIAGFTGYGATIDNVHVVNASVSSNRYVAGISGFAAGTISNCSVENLTVVATPNEVSGGVYDNGDKAGGIVGYINTPEGVAFTTISRCELKGSVTITAYRDLGGIAGMVQPTTILDGNTNAATLKVKVNENPSCTSSPSGNAGEFYGRNTPAVDKNTTAAGASYDYAASVKGLFARPAYFDKATDRTRIWDDIIKLGASESIVVKMYSGDTLLSTTTLNDSAKPDVLGTSGTTLDLVVSGRPSGSWDTQWEPGHPVANVIPTRLELYVDGVLADETAVIMQTDRGEAIDWASIEGVNSAPEGEGDDAQQPNPPAGDNGSDAQQPNSPTGETKPAAAKGSGSETLAQTGDSSAFLMMGLGASLVVAAGACAAARRRAE